MAGLGVQPRAAEQHSVLLKLPQECTAQYITLPLPSPKQNTPPKPAGLGVYPAGVGSKVEPSQVLPLLALAGKE